jgi:hypothetical protein
MFLAHIYIHSDRGFAGSRNAGRGFSLHFMYVVCPWAQGAAALYVAQRNEDSDACFNTNYQLPNGLIKVRRRFKHLNDGVTKQVMVK